MVKTTLHDENVLGAIGEGQLAAVGDGAFCGTLILRD